ncbi:MAG: Mrp/NBP35 family ATP-binding protein [Bacteroidales bacterium]
MELNKENVKEVLKKIKHPGSGQDIITEAMAGDIVVDKGKVSLTLNTGNRSDPFAKSVKRACEDALKSTFGNSLDIDVTILSPQPKQDNKQPVLPGVKNLIAIASGKGGVGKSTVAVNLAVALARAGYGVGLIDADIYGPSVPGMMGAPEERPRMREDNGRHIIIPVERYGVKFLSIGLFVPAENALVWRGPMATGAFKQLINDADWGELDYLIFDLPPGTSDIHLTLVQEVAVTGAVIVSTPQEVALADVIKGVSMFRSEEIAVPVLGLVENMAWFTPAELPDNRYYIFGRDGCRKLANKMNLPLLAEIPIVQGIREGGDQGTPVAAGDSVSATAFSRFAERLTEEVEKRNKTMAPTKRVEIKK